MADADGDADFGPCIHPVVTKDCADGWCQIPEGCFVQGSPPGEPWRGKYNEEQRPVRLTRPFIIMDHEVTVSEWSALGFESRNGWMGIPKNMEDCAESDCPACGMVHSDAARFANALSVYNGLQECYVIENCTGRYIAQSELVDGGGTSGVKGPDCSVRLTTSTPYDCAGFRLPTAAEWEYAARAGTKTAIYSGDVLSVSDPGDCIADPNMLKIGWYCYNASSTEGGVTLYRTQRVLQKEPNGWGLYDMSGNAQELTSDAYEPDRPPTPQLDPWILEGGVGHEIRGGFVVAFNAGCRSALRDLVFNDQREPGLGFRLVRTVTPNMKAPKFPSPG